MKKLIILFTTLSLVLLLVACGSDNEESDKGSTNEGMTSEEYNDEVQKLYDEFEETQSELVSSHMDLLLSIDEDLKLTDSKYEDEFMTVMAEFMLMTRDLCKSYSELVISGNEDSEKLAELFQEAVAEIDEYHGNFTDMSYEEFVNSDEFNNNSILSDDLSNEIDELAFKMADDGVISEDTAYDLTSVLY